MSSRISLERLRTSARARRNLGIAVRLVIALFLIAFSIFPILWVISASFDPTGSLATQRLIPARAGLGNYRELMTSGEIPFWRWLGNSVKIASITSVISLSITTIAAYAFSRFRFRGRVTMLKGILLINVFPGLLALVATFLMISQLGDILPAIGLNTHASLILIYLGGAMGINIWLMKGYFDSIPRDIDESAAVDGATHWQAFWALIFPLVRPVLAVVGVLAFVGTYNEFILARILLRSTEQFTLMAGLYLYVDQNFAQSWGIFAAGALLGAIPAAVIYTVLQDYIVSGLTGRTLK